MDPLKEKKCLPCQADQPPLAPSKIKALQVELGKNWSVENNKKLSKSFSFKNFKKALAFVNDIGKVSEEEGHHPDIKLSWGRVEVELWTHKINGLSENDFILAEKIDALYISDTGKFS